jgi:hypothetical protein
MSAAPLSSTNPDDYLIGLVEWNEFGDIYLFDS